MEDKLEKNLVWIIASRRSGTSWLGEELLSHKTKFMDEPLIGNHIAGILGRDSVHYRRLEESQNRRDYFFHNEFKETWSYFLRKLILNRIYAQFQDLESMIVIKEPNGSMGADILMEILPESKMITLLRDPRDVIHSNLAQISPQGFAVKFRKVLTPLNEKQRLNELKFRSKDWNSLIDIILGAYENHNEGLKCLIKYEDLRANTFEELKKIYKFIGIQIDDETLNKIIEKFTFENIPDSKKGVGTQKQFAIVGIWKDKFTSDEIKEMNAVLGSNLEKIGYKV